jgi:hypothetical protein
MSRKEFADHIEMSVKTIERYMAQGMPVIRGPGGRTGVRINVDDAMAWLNTQNSAKDTPAAPNPKLAHLKLDADGIPEYRVEGTVLRARRRRPNPPK